MRGKDDRELYLQEWFIKNKKQATVLDLGSTYENVSDELRVQVHFSDKVPKGESLLLYFPSLPDRMSTSRIYDIKSGQSIHRFHKIIQERLNASGLSDTKIALVYKGHMYKCAHVCGVLNILWAHHVVTWTKGSTKTVETYKIPLVVQTNGTLGILSFTMIGYQNGARHVKVKNLVYWTTGRCFPSDYAPHRNQKARKNRLFTHKQVSDTMTAEKDAQVRQAHHLLRPFEEEDDGGIDLTDVKDALGSDAEIPSGWGLQFIPAGSDTPDTHSPNKITPRTIVTVTDSEDTLHDDLSSGESDHTNIEL